MKSGILKITIIAFLLVTAAGCTFIIQPGRRSDMRKIEELSAQLDELNKAKSLLEQRLGSEIGDNQVNLKMMEKGLVVTVLGDLLFDSGKAKIRHQAYSVLDKVAKVLKENVPQFNVAIEGYTDNQPIKHSGWKSNWELSSARALSVLHYMVNEQGISPSRLSFVGYGEYNPVASNDTKEGRQLNRRVEIVVQPQITKVRPPQEQENSSKLIEPKENLK